MNEDLIARLRNAAKEERATHEFAVVDCDEIADALEAANVEIARLLQALRAAGEAVRESNERDAREARWRKRNLIDDSYPPV